MPMSKCCSRWSNLPNDIQEVILKRLGLVDCIRASAVCRSWRYLLDKKKKQQLPLLLSSGPLAMEICSFYNLFDTSTTCRQTMSSEAISNGRLCGCSHGWWIFSSFGDRGVYLFDPNERRGRREIQLPALPMSSSYSPAYLSKAILSCAPATSIAAADCIVIAKIYLHSQASRLAFCRPRDREWTLFQDESSWDFFEDMIFLKGKCYAISFTIWAGYKIVVYDIGGNNRPPQTSASYYLKQDPPTTFIDSESIMYLVECRGDLLLVTRPPGNMHVPAIELFRVDFGTNKLVKVESLGEDCALFLSSCRYWSSLSSARILGGKGNCIYYIKEDDDHLGVFDLRNGIHTFFPINLDFGYSHLWVTTDPW